MFFRKSSTSESQGTLRVRITELEAEIKAIKREIRVLTGTWEDHEDRVTRRLERYRAWAKPRKDGKFAAEEQNGTPALPTNPTHDQIRAEARRQGLMV